MTNKKHLIIVGFGPVASYKYSRCIKSAIEQGVISSYSIVDLETQRDTVLARIKGLPAQPDGIFFLPNSDGFTVEDGINHFDSVCRDIVNKTGSSIKVIISTEAQAHEAYLDYCISNGFDSLTTKPILLPMKEGLFDPISMNERMQSLVSKAKERPANHAVLCLGRYHEVYNEGVEAQILEKMSALQVPITSINFKTSSGVWNLENEFLDREDHPYKYGYGMLMHGAYHYIDLVAQFLTYNKLIYPDMNFGLDVVTFSAYPKDQSIRIPANVTKLLSDFEKCKSAPVELDGKFGETDVVSTFRLFDADTNQTLTLGSLTLEQTTPGMRSWGPFHEVPYNINGRLHCTDLDVRLATIFAANAHVIKTPIGGRQGPTDLRGRNSGRITVRSNIEVTGDQEFHTEQSIHRPYGNSFSYSAEYAVFNDWLCGKQTRSSLESHLASVALLQALAESQKHSGEKITIDYNYQPRVGVIDLVKNKIDKVSLNERGNPIFAAYAP